MDVKGFPLACEAALQPSLGPTVMTSTGNGNNMFSDPVSFHELL